MTSTAIRRKLRVILVILTLAAGPWSAQAATQGGKVNINTADAEALALLPRVGSVVAQRIVEFRQKNGKFKAIEDLLLVQGIGDRTFELMQPYLALDGETTLKEKVRTPRGTSPESGPR